MIWVGKEHPQSNSYCFDAEPHFQYFNEYTKREEYKKDLESTGLTQTMSLQGSCFMLTREKYWDLDICSETFGSWGNQGIEVAVKTWLSGGQVLVNHNTWYAHMFRTQGGDFGFPFPLSGDEVSKTKKKVKDLFFNDKWDKAVYPLSWLVEKFWPVKCWTEEDLTKLKANKFEFRGSNVVVKTEEVEPVPMESELVEEPGEKEVLPEKSELPETLPVYLAGISQPAKRDRGGPTLPAARRGRPRKLFNNITVIGDGWVGKSVHNLFPDAFVYDPPKSVNRRKANNGDIAFICVPTSPKGESELDTGIVEECVAWCQCPLIVIRSTVNPGTCDYLSKKYNKSPTKQEFAVLGYPC